MPDEYSKVGFSLPDSQIQELDDIRDDWDDREVGRVSRSQVAREALALGLEALDVIDDNPTMRRMSTRDRAALLRQALLDELSE